MLLHLPHRSRITFPYLFARLGQGCRTDVEVHAACKYFGPGPGGLPGNDAAGGAPLSGRELGHQQLSTVGQPQAVLAEDDAGSAVGAVEVAAPKTKTSLAQ